jgi:UDP-N-acetylglucosamine diphosphorylase/glucosamine-1-phosphate N-acetyltransferase
MNLILFDDNCREQLLPFTFTRPVAEIRIGILTIREKWERFFNVTASHLTEEYLSQKFKLIKQSDNLLVNGSVLPTQPMVDAIKKLQIGEYLVNENIVIAARLDNNFSNDFYKSIESVKAINFTSTYLKINNLWDIFSLNGEAIDADFAIITKGRKSAPISKTNHVLCSENIFIEEGAVAEFTTLNASKGPIYLGSDSEVMEGSLIRGPFVLCEHSAVKMGAKVYGPTTIGPHSKIGGEVSNSVIFGYSNKAHEGYLGNSVLGEWCNIGADTNNSNLKNNYSEVKLWSYVKEGFIPTGLQFCGLIMGDHSKCGINTMFNTGTVVGISANIFGAGYPRNFIPSFSWGGPQGLTVYPLKKAFETEQIVHKRRGKTLREVDKDILTHVFNLTEKYRRF